MPGRFARANSLMRTEKPGFRRRARIHRDLVRRRRSGVVAVEFALILPILLLILVGVIDFSLMLYNQAMLTNAAREGARWGVVTSNYAWASGCTSTSRPATPTSPCEVANKYAGIGMVTFGAPGAASTTATSSNGANPGATVSVTTSYGFSGLVFSFNPFSVGGTGTLTATVRMAHE